MAVAILLLVSVAVIGLLLLVIGILSARRLQPSWSLPDYEDLILAGRNLHILVGISSLSVTLVGSGSILGGAELMFYSGLAWNQGLFAYPICLLIGCFFFAGKMRSAGYMTMVDPFFQKFGKISGCLITSIVVLAELCLANAVLASIGASITLMTNINSIVVLLAVMVVIIIYTSVGGMCAVAFTSVVKIGCVTLGLWLSVPFMWRHSAGQTQRITRDTFGSISPSESAMWLDYLLIMTLGTIPWQAYFQRVLSSRTVTQAKVMSAASVLAFILCALPAGLIGVVAKTTDWNATSWEGPIPLPLLESKLILPISLQYLCPSWVAAFGLMALTAGCMSAVDSSLLSAASVLTRALNLCWSKTSETCSRWLFRLSVIIMGAVVALLTLLLSTHYGLWYFTSNLLYVFVLPQLVSVLYIKFSNGYGSLCSLPVGFLLTLLVADSLMPTVIRYPWYSNGYQKFPVHTFHMLITFLVLVLVSFASQYLFERKLLPRRLDVLGAVRHSDEGQRQSVPMEAAKR